VLGELQRIDSVIRRPHSVFEADAPTLGPKVEFKEEISARRTFALMRPGGKRR